LAHVTSNYEDLILGFAREFDAALFDLDILEAEDRITFLEINFSPAPIYFERIVEPKKRFSRTVLADFLS
jgi:glutathione synthase/RimK-type ligase-like ATP-grasp enzyme